MGSESNSEHDRHAIPRRGRASSILHHLREFQETLQESLFGNTSLRSRKPSKTECLSDHSGSPVDLEKLQKREAKKKLYPVPHCKFHTFEADERPKRQMSPIMENVKKHCMTNRLKNRNIPANKYFRLTLLYCVGKFGSYYRGHAVDSTERYIFKIFNPGFCEKKSQKIEKEILSNEFAPAVIPYLFLYFSNHFQTCLVLEDMSTHSLAEQLMHVRRLPAPVTQFYMTEIISAVAFLHDNGIIHRNLTPDAFWIQTTGHIKLTDFSYCVRATHMKYGCGRGLPPFGLYTPPEIIQKKRYNKQVDIWALGVLLYRMSSGLMPFYGENKKELMKHIVSQPETYAFAFPLSCMTLCSLLLQKEPQNRPAARGCTFEALCIYSFFGQINWDEVLTATSRVPAVPLIFATGKGVVHTMKGQPTQLDLQSGAGKRYKKRPLLYNYITSKPGFELFTEDELQDRHIHNLERDCNTRHSLNTGGMDQRKLRPYSIRKVSTNKHRRTVAGGVDAAIQNFERNMESEMEPVVALEHFRTQINETADAVEMMIFIEERRKKKKTNQAPTTHTW